VQSNAAMDEGAVGQTSRLSLKHAQRDLLRLAIPICCLYSILLELEVGPEGSRESTWWPCLNPYEVFASIFEAGMMQFAVSFLGLDGPGSVADFWETARKSSVFQDHPALSETAEVLARLVPILIFYDGADIYRDKEYCWFLWSSAVSRGQDWDCEIPLLCIPACYMKSSETQRLVFAWEITAL
jgi:hypothetical protein